MEEALIDSAVMRRFARLNRLDNVPDETTILDFCRLPEDRGLARSIFDRVIAHRVRKGRRTSRRRDRRGRDHCRTEFDDEPGQRA